MGCTSSAADKPVDLSNEGVDPAEKPKSEEIKNQEPAVDLVDPSSKDSAKLTEDQLSGNLVPES